MSAYRDALEAMAGNWPLDRIRIAQGLKLPRAQLELLELGDRQWAKVEECCRLRCEVERLKREVDGLRADNQALTDLTLPAPFTCKGTP